MKNLNLQNVEAKASGNVPTVEPGGYICRIMNVVDKPDKECLMIDLDIAAGPYKDYYQDLVARAGFWGCTMYWSYKENNLPYFKGNVTSVEESNKGYTFSDQNENALIGKLVGAVFGEEEYMSNSGEVKCNVKPRFLCSVQRIMDHDYKVPNRKVYKPEKDRRRSQNNARRDNLTPVGKDDLDAWAQGQKLPWDDDDSLPF